MSVFHSDDGAGTWKRSDIPFYADRADPRVHVDREYVVADSTRGRFHGRVYLYGQMEGQGLEGTKLHRALVLWRSLDRGKSFERPIQRLVTEGTFFWPGNAVVLSDGTFGAILIERNVTLPAIPPNRSFPSANGSLRFLRSADGGESLDPAVKVSDVYADFFVAGLPTIAADTSRGPFQDRLYAVWSDLRLDGRTRVMLSYSADRGKNWSPPSVVSDDPPRVAGSPMRASFMPTVAVNRDGVVGVSWYDGRENSNELDYTVRFAASLDGGETFTPSARVSEGGHIHDERETWMPSWAPRTITTAGNAFRARLRVNLNERYEGGDTAGLAADANGVFHPFWISNETGIDQVWTAAVTVKGSAVRNGAPELSSFADVTGRCVLVLEEARYDRATHRMTMAIRVKNVSDEPIDGPLRLRAINLTSPIGVPRAINSDNRVEGAGAVWDFSGQLSDGVLPAKASSAPREITLEYRGLIPRPFLDGFDPRPFSDGFDYPELLTFDARVLAGGASK